jgi:formylmethanofuran dehydrogenase subunit E
MKRFYGAEITMDIKCNRCGESFQEVETVEEQASYFESLI